MKIKLHSPLEEVQIQIIPLIDVVFCVLTFFILAALQFTRQQAINVDLPKASTGKTTPQMRQMLIVTIDPGGQTYVEQKPVNKDQLYQTLQTYHQTNPAGLMVLNASRSTSYNQVVQVLDLLRQVGGDRAALATLPTSSDQPAGSNPATPDSSPTQPLNGQSINPVNPALIPLMPTTPHSHANSHPQK